MPPRTLSPTLLALQRRQLDAQLKDTPPLNRPPVGWIRTIRQALGMTAAQLGSRMGISDQSVLDLERREVEGTITLAKLEQAAAALNCELRTVLVPMSSLEESVQRQADEKARSEQNDIIHTMRLEAQAEGVEEALARTRAREAWLTTRLAQLWDQS